MRIFAGLEPQLILVQFSSLPRMIQNINFIALAISSFTMAKYTMYISRMSYNSTPNRASKEDYFLTLVKK